MTGITEQDILNACEFAVKEGSRTGMDIEAYGVFSTENSVSIERNDIATGISMEYSGIGIRTFKNGAIGFASVNSLNREDIKKAVESAIKIASSSPPTGEYNRLPEPPERSAYREVKGLYDPAIEDFTMEDALDHALRMLQAAREDRRVMVDSGSLESGMGARAIASSNGLSLSERSSSISYMIMGMARDGEDVSSFNYRYKGTHRLSEVDTERTGREFAELVLKTLGAKKTESFRGQVILTPDAFVDLLISPIMHLVNADNVQKGRSSFADKIGERVASERLTITDDGTVNGGLGSSMFDREGIPHSPLSIVQNGTLKSFLHNTKTAIRAGLGAEGSTGHATGGFTGVPGIGSTNLDIAAGDISLDEMIADVKKGIILTRMSGYPDPISGQYSATVKGGMLVEKGEIVRPITGTMISGNIFENLNNISHLSKEREELFSVLAPYALVDNVSIISE